LPIVAAGYEMTYPPELMLKAAKMAFPLKKWVVADSIDCGKIIIVDNGLNHRHYHKIYDDTFNPLDPTKGDLAALNEALECAGWIFSYAVDYDIEPSEDGRLGRIVGEQWLYFAAHPFHETIKKETPAERAMRCVEVMP
jgi:hypothetical protein